MKNSLKVAVKNNKKYPDIVMLVCKFFEFCVSRVPVFSEMGIFKILVCSGGRIFCEGCSIVDSLVVCP